MADHVVVSSRERDVVGAPHFHPLGRDAPGGLRPDDLVPAQVSHFSGPSHSEGEEKQRGFERRPAVVLVDRGHQRAELLLVGDRRTVMHHGSQQGALQRVCRVGGRPERRDSEAKTLPIAPRSLLAVSLRPLFSYRLRIRRISAGVISAIGLLMSGDARSRRSQRTLLSVASAAPFSFKAARCSSAIAP